MRVAPGFKVVMADDVNVETADGPQTAFWNFTVDGKDGEDATTVAGFPFADVLSVTSEPA